jgi:hypothetical protein
MKSNNPILFFRNMDAESEEAMSLTYNIHTGLHGSSDPDHQQLVFTNSMQTKSREAIDTIEYSEI